MLCPSSKTGRSLKVAVWGGFAVRLKSAIGNRQFDRSLAPPAKGREDPPPVADRPYKIMLVEPDPPLVEILVHVFSEQFEAHITCVAEAKTCLDVELVEPHDLVVAERDLSDAKGLALAEQLLALSHRPVILLGENWSASESLAALRMGVKDLLTKPFPVAELVETSRRALYGMALKRKHQVRYHRLREMVRRAVRERRDLNSRIDLVCRDLVEAQRRLVRRVVELEGARSTKY